MQANELKQFQQRLERERASLLERIRADDQLRLLVEGEGGDGAMAQALRESDLALLQIEREELLRIDEALERIALGTFGLCTHCGNPIGAARLDALPMAAWCLSCKSEFEQRRGIVGHSH